ncbi:MAG: pyridoxal-phosphate dependent enzyme [Melioribacteraceae bacterium]|nr:pyridoxal-phosphate dependent enzyme [Melioribacteraceae bacterium]
MSTEVPLKINIEEAHRRIKPYIHKTPIFTSSAINEITESELFFKCENLQRVGAFKMRGAVNALMSLSGVQLQKGVATHSSGNHAAALSLAARMNGINAFIVMPRTAPGIKVAAVESYGGKITFCESTQEAREKTLEEIINKSGAQFIHPYNNYRIIEGQATCAKEILEDLESPDFLVAPVGGGGLLSGTCLSAAYFGDKVKVIGAEPSGADDAFRSIRDSVIYPSINPKTIADGLLTSLCERTYEIIREHVYKILTVEDELIIKAMKLLWERMKLIVEPSGAVPLAVVIKNPGLFRGKRVGLIISGGNVDIQNLPW